MQTTLNEQHLPMDTTNVEDLGTATPAEEPQGITACGTTRTVTPVIRTILIYPAHEHRETAAPLDQTLAATPPFRDSLSETSEEPPCQVSTPVTEEAAPLIPHAALPLNKEDVRVVATEVLNTAIQQAMA